MRGKDYKFHPLQEELLNRTDFPWFYGGVRAGSMSEFLEADYLKEKILSASKIISKHDIKAYKGHG